ncbi:odorant-binding protein 83cd [Musca autumnalis]|uniref:odorant-binding protein 83cd n=1 Tax=Musca autumnalis TaxID=221902 RepID=UPI003CEB6493
METWYSIFIITLAILLHQNLVLADINQHEGYVLGKCLERYGGVSEENAERLGRFKDWSINYEELPCFTNCYLTNMFDFYNETDGFNEEKVINKFGASVYEVCKPKFSEGKDKCEIAYKGFHCMINLENDPFVVIDGMDNIDMDAKLAMKDCLHKFDRSEWQVFGDYSRFPVKEPIPCYTRCFLEKLQLFNHRLHTWDIRGLNTKLNLSVENANTSACEAMAMKRNRNICGWMYKEFTCYAMAASANN